MARDIDMYAPPQSTGWSAWHTILNHLGTVVVDIDCSPTGSTQIYGQVRYWKGNGGGSQVTEMFIESTQIRTAQCVATVEIRLQGNPFGSQVRVTVNP